MNDSGDAVTEALRRAIIKTEQLREDIEQALLDLVRREIAIVLALASPDQLEIDRPLQEIGLDSYMAVEIRNGLAAAIGQKLPATLLFNYPTPAALSRYLATLLTGHAALPQPAPLLAPAKDEPIAIVAIGCRFPGVRTPEELWSLLCEGRDAISGFPDNRGWDLPWLHDPDPDATSNHAREGGFLHDADRFDPAFFGISPREALGIDPQQRLLLEASWEALERARIDPASLHGSQTGVFVGIYRNDYLAQHSPDRLEPVKTHLATGAATSVASGRIAYTLGLHGPAVSLDTACSSSLVALHMAAQALRHGECTLALAGGVTVMASPRTFAVMGTDSAGSADGRCKAFSAAADGAGWSEGVGMLVLERLSDARRGGHPVLALLKGSAINQDGRSQGLSAPNGPAQESVIRQALTSAGLAPQDIDAVEAHGTGTALGDPIEAQALLATYGKAHAPERPLWLGSLKSNIGHAQAAAGVGSVIKMVLALQNGLLPKTLHAENPSPHIDWSSGTVRLLTDAVRWAPDGRPRRAGVSSFGISGTNAHVIIEEAPAAEPAEVEPSAASLATWPLLLSARCEAALRGQAERLRAHVLSHHGLSLADLAYSLATTRTPFEHRAAILAETDAELLAALDAIARGDSAPNTRLGRARDEGKVVFLFTGQGSQRAEMGRALYEAFPIFRDAFDAVCAHLDGDLERPLHEVMFVAEDSPDASLLDRTAFTQPALFALEVALFRLLERFGLKPDLLLGHSIGELAAAHVAGVLSLGDACALVGARARLMQALRQDGAMATIQAAEHEVLALIAGQENCVGIAALNGPLSTVLTGDADAVFKIAFHFESMGRKTTRLKVSHAFHSHHMDAMLKAFHRVAETLTYHPARIPIISNLTGTIASDEQLGDPNYWVRHVRQAVRFLDGVRAARSEGAQVFVELGPQGVLTALAEGVLGEEGANLSFVPTLRKGRHEAWAMVAALAELYTCGLAFDWPAFFAPYAPQRVALPTYAFQRERFWLEARRQRAADLAAAGQSAAAHPLLAAAVALADSDGLLFTGRLSLADHPWLTDHAVFGTPILPGTAFVEMALFAAQRAHLDGIEELTLEAPLALPADGAMQFQLLVGAADGGGRRTLSVHSRAEGAAEDAPWTRHASGVLGTGDEALAFDLRHWPPAGAVPLPIDGLYEERLAMGGISYGPGFQGLRAAWRQGEELFAEATLPDELTAEGFALHPALLDAALHALALDAGEGGSAVRLLFSWSGVSLRAVGATTLRVRLSRAQDGTISLAVADAAGEPVAAVNALATRAVTAEQLQGSLSARQAPLYLLQWTPASLAAGKPAHGVILGQGSADDPALSLQRRADLAALQRSLDQGAPAPDLVVVALDSPSPFDPALAHRTAADGLALLQAWLADERLAASRLVLLTRRAVGTRPDEDVLDLSQAPLWGLARTAQRESPDRRLFLVDTDGSDASHTILTAVLDADERQCALRNGRCLVPRLGRAARTAPATARHFDPQGTVLITGGTGTLGGLVARHLVAAHGVKHLLLTSRQGPGAERAETLRADLEAAGATATIVRCDAADREALRSLFEAIPAGHPLTAVLHAAGVLDDGMLHALTPERLEKVFAPKLNAAWHLHELTRDRDLAAFVLFSSVSGLSGAPGQANYAAANAFLDALAHHRQAQGLVASSLAWGLWTDGMGGRLQAADIARMRRSGTLPLSSDQGLALLDAALERSETLLVPARFDLGVLAARGEPPALLRGLVHTRRSATNTAVSSFAQRLLALPESEREQALLDLVRREIATVLALASPDQLETDRPLQEIGLDSLMAVEIRNRLAAAIGQNLPATLLFNHPTSRAIAATLIAALKKEHAIIPAHDTPVGDQDGALVHLIRTAEQVGAYKDGQDILSLATRLRIQSQLSLPKTITTAVKEASSFQLTRGPSSPVLICIPPFLPPSGPFVYARFVSNLKKRQDIWVISHPGYEEDQTLAIRLSDLIASRAQSALQCAGDMPFVLLGHSAGAWIAYMVAAHAEKIGHRAAGVVLLDPIDKSHAKNRLREIHSLSIKEASSLHGISDATLTASSWYHELCSIEMEDELHMVRPNAPVLHVRASEEMKHMKKVETSFIWNMSKDVTYVPGDHMSMLYKQETADVVDDWLSSLAIEMSTAKSAVGAT